MNGSRLRRQLRGGLYKEGSSVKRRMELASAYDLARVVVGRRLYYNT